MISSSSSLLDIVRVPQQSLTGSLLVRNLDDVDRKWKISVAILSDDALYLLQPPSIEWIIIPLIHATAEPGGGGGGGGNDGYFINGSSSNIFTMHTARISFTFKAPSERSAKGWVDAINELSEIANDNALLAAPEHLAEDLLEHAFAQPLIELEAKCEAAERLKVSAEQNGIHNSTSSPPSSRPRKMGHNSGRHMDVLKASLPPSPLLVRAAKEQYPVFSINLDPVQNGDTIQAIDALVKNEVEDVLYSFHWGLSQKPPQSSQRLQTLAAAEALLMASADSILSSNFPDHAVSSEDTSQLSSSNTSSSYSFSSLYNVPSPLLLEAAYLSCSTPFFVSRSFKLRAGRKTGGLLSLENKEIAILTPSQESPSTTKSLLGGVNGKASPNFSARYGNSG